MFLYILIPLFSCVIASDLQESDANSIPLVDVHRSPVFSLNPADILNANFPKAIQTYSKDLTFYFGMEMGEKFPYRSVRHRNYSKELILPIESISRLRAYDGESLLFVPKDNESVLKAYNFKRKTFIELSHSQHHFQSIKLSKKSNQKLYAFLLRKSYKKEEKQSHEIALINTKNGEVIKKGGLKLIDAIGNHFKIVETNDLQNTIIYCRYAGESNAWLFNAIDFQLIKKLPYHHVHSCKTNASGDLVAINSNHEVCVCASDDLENKLYSFNIFPQTPLSMRFITDSYLLVTARNNHYVPQVIVRRNATYDAAISRDFLSLFEQFKSKAPLQHVPNNEKDPNAVVYVFDLNLKKSIFEKQLSLQYGFRLIKQCFDEEGSLKTNQFALRDSGCFDGQWYMLSVAGLE